MDRAIKPYQTHKALAALSRRCHTKVARFVASADERTLKATIGRLRTRIRRELLGEELARIDEPARECLRRAGADL